MSTSVVFVYLKNRPSAKKFAHLIMTNSNYRMITVQIVTFELKSRIFGVFEMEIQLFDTKHTHAIEIHVNYQSKFVNFLGKWNQRSLAPISKYYIHSFICQLKLIFRV